MFRIEPLAPADWAIAMNLALAHLPEESRPERVSACLNLLANGTLDPRAIRIARNPTGTIVGVQVCVPLAGATCLFWLPTAPADIADALVDSCLAMCREQGLKIAQAFANPNDVPSTGPLIRRGFRHVTRMYQLQHPLSDVPRTGSALLRFVTFQSAPSEYFTKVLQRTYEGTQDCPELNGRRTIDEIIAGHQAEGKFDPTRWWLAYRGEEAVGVVLLAELLDAVTWDLAYLGIVPEHRRRGHGRAMLRHAMQAAVDQTATRLIAAVDARNAPALQLYEAEGFARIDSCEVLLCFLTPPSAT
jgi:mycothiol synthase